MHFQTTGQCQFGAHYFHNLSERGMPGDGGVAGEGKGGVDVGGKGGDALSAAGQSDGDLMSQLAGLLQQQVNSGQMPGM